MDQMEEAGLREKEPDENLGMTVEVVCDTSMDEAGSTVQVLMIQGETNVRFG